MLFLWKLPYNIRYNIKFVAYALICFCIIRFLQSWSTRHTVDYRDILPGFRLFFYSGNYSYPVPKHILLWNNFYFSYYGWGEEFPNLQCRVNNCIFTDNKDLLGDDYSRFDAIIFSEQVLYLKNILKGFPINRSRSQIYIFSTLESAYNNPACDLKIDNFFNWTLTYRLDSDVLWSYFLVRNAFREVVAPSVYVKWEEYSEKPIPPRIMTILRQKTKAAMWLVSHCKAESSRDDYLSRLQEHLYHFSLQVDVYGDCSKVKCIDDNCGAMITKDYYFYMAFENSFSEDYVTEKVLHAYDNYAVPIVYGGANYTRFLPPGSYLNARELHPYHLAYIIHEVIRTPAKFYEFFKWTNTYTIDANVPDQHPLCHVCEDLNSNKMRRRKTYKRFRHWWNGRNGMKWCLPDDYWNETSLLHLDTRHLFHMY